ncbi:HpcH/HpaI aldolase family protein [Chloroflexus aggregans]|uniref:HpcH/HpaI aldolase n=1 Tax=Chloroflexus aggregans (strain MD-66 / DSM 9485) TaxID=326427 RepID=B8GAV7_CHLAD|nr:aldolase/citrate lyase family protein [Chloroflexus aggregans]ACL24696.1 HpcH/HpaI aldolase [Chloroflexus aggregans DSM 9485]
MIDTIRQQWTSGAVVYNAWLTIPSPWSAELLATAGFPSLTIDLQHGLIDDPTALQILHTIDQRRCPVFVRLAWNEPAAIMRALDRGAAGIIAPLINGPDDARALVAACRFPPEGIRSYGPVRVGVAHGVAEPAAVARLPVLMPMIETANAMEQLEAIAEVPGIDGLYVGPADLSLSLGLPVPVDFSAPSFRAALSRIVAVCRQRGLATGIYANPDLAADLAALGFNFITIVNDGDLIMKGAVAALQTVRA